MTMKLSPEDMRSVEKVREAFLNECDFYNGKTGEVMLGDISEVDPDCPDVGPDSDVIMSVDSDGSEYVYAQLYGVMTANVPLEDAIAAAKRGETVCDISMGCIPAPATGAPNRMGFISLDEACEQITSESGWGIDSIEHTLSFEKDLDKGRNEQQRPVSLDTEARSSLEASGSLADTRAAGLSSHDEPGL